MNRRRCRRYTVLIQTHWYPSRCGQWGWICVFFVANFVKFLRAFYALAQTYRDFHGLLGIRPTQGHTTLSERIQTNMSFFLFFCMLVGTGTEGLPINRAARIGGSTALTRFSKKLFSWILFVFKGIPIHFTLFTFCYTFRPKTISESGLVSWLQSIHIDFVWLKSNFHFLL